MHLDLGTLTPSIKLGLVSASRNCFPRKLSQDRMDALVGLARESGQELTIPQGSCTVIETKAHAREAARQLREAGCDAAVLYLGNFSPEIEDAFFIKEFGGQVMIIAAAEESGSSLAKSRGDALCGLLSAVLGVQKRQLLNRVYLPEMPVVSAAEGVNCIAHFRKVMQVVKGISKSTIGLFGPRPRDFETCNYNIASLQSIGVEIEELGLFDLINKIKSLSPEDSKAVAEEMLKQMPSTPREGFEKRLSDYEVAIQQFRKELELSGAATQCWSEQELALKHVPCFINGRMAFRGFPIACENDAYSLVAELMSQYASNKAVTILDINHSIPADLHDSLRDYPLHDMVGMFHCGNTAPELLKDPEMKHQVIMKRMMEPDNDPDITRGTIEGQIAASPITIVQVHGAGDKLRAYLAEGHFLDLDPKTFGCTGTAYIPGFKRFYRHIVLGRFHHHCAVAFEHCGAVLFDAFKLLGIEETYTPLPDCVPYPGENIFQTNLLKK